MALDLDTMKSAIVADVPMDPSPRFVAGSRGDSVYLAEMERVLEVTHRSQTWHIEPVGSVNSDTPFSARMAVTEDGAGIAAWCGSDICIASRGVRDAEIRRVKLSAALQARVHAMGLFDTLVWTSKHRLVATFDVTERSAGEYAETFDRTLEIWVIDPGTASDRRLAVTAAGGWASANEDGQLAWVEKAGKDLVLAVGSIDDLRAARRAVVATATRDAALDCAFVDAGRLVCLLVDPPMRSAMSLVLFTSATGVMTDIQSDPRYSIPNDRSGSRFISPDRRWIAYERTGEELSSHSEWVIARIDAVNAPLSHVLGSDDQVLAWFR